MDQMRPIMGAEGLTFVDTAFEKEQKAVMQQMNSPAMRVIQDQEKLREAKARAQQTEQLLMQSYMQVV